MRRDKPEGAGRVASKTVYAAQGKSPDGENQRNRNRRMANMAPTPEIPTRMVAGSGTGLALDISGGEPAAAGTGAADNIPAARVKTVTITNDINVRRFIFWVGFLYLDPRELPETIYHAGGKCQGTTNSKAKFKTKSQLDNQLR